MRWRKSVFLIGCCLLLSGVSIAQTDSTQTGSTLNRFRFHPVIAVGLLEGESSSALQLQAVNGVQYRTWFAGIGAGIDRYAIRSIPLFLDVRKNFGIGRAPLFAYADGGVHFLWPRKTDESFRMPDEYRNGVYYEAGLGYRLLLKRQSALLFSAGYSEKKYRRDAAQYYPCLVAPCPEVKQRFDYTLRRIAVKAGWMF